MFRRQILAASFQNFVRQISSEAKKTFILEYHYVPNILEKRVPFREAHLKYANSFVADKMLVAGGAMIPADMDVVRGMLLVQAKDVESVRKFANNDPYVTGGLVTRYDINEWAVAVGDI